MAFSTGAFLVLVFLLVDPSRCQKKNETRAKECQKTMTFGWGDAVDRRSRCIVDPSGKPINHAGRFVKVRARSDNDPSIPASNVTLHHNPHPKLQSRMLDSSTQGPSATLQSLLDNTRLYNGERSSLWAASARSEPSCSQACAAQILPDSCCPVRTEVAYPQFGQSAISEQTFTIIQDFPDFVQPVFKRVCITTQCNIIRGNCSQKYVPHAVFSAPNGKFGSLFGQDYLLVESGCECTPAITDFGTSATPPPVEQITQPPPFLTSTAPPAPIPNSPYQYPTVARDLQQGNRNSIIAQ
ncbi:hypothetical protein RvY_17932-2 [Ramazzottius varieornatus]|uniref:Spaetzle domain-containing protein n=1 Tax=Ramazzottius varieornatus TaxID=947166 RepID=A0A1D1W3Y4_RAMVA|nr:hypothetical protein RvY_17932-2 [Ramazzottius varieornatus]